MAAQPRQNQNPSGKPEDGKQNSEPEIPVTTPVPVIKDIEMDGESSAPLPQQSGFKKMEPTPYDLTTKDEQHLREVGVQLAKNKATAAIEQAVRDSETIARSQVLSDATTTALQADPGNLSLLAAFLKRFGPSNVKPPRPELGPHGVKAEEYIRYLAMYEPAEFKQTYKNSNAPLVVQLRRTINNA